jgi:hypothetical protein
MNEIKLDVDQIVITPGSIVFNEYKAIKNQAQKLADQIVKVEVNDENLKQSKKLLAAVNKRLTELEDKRKSVKKAMLEPYEVFEDQVKEIVGIVKEADAEVRKQVKDLEEAERQEKEDRLKQIFNERIKFYDFSKLVQFNDFLKPEYLNKSKSINSIEEEMVQFLEKIETDIKVMNTMEKAERIVSAYFSTFDVVQAIDQINKEDERTKEIEASGAIKKSPAEKIAFVLSVQVYNQKELKFLEMLLKENGFKFHIDKVGF